MAESPCGGCEPPGAVPLCVELDGALIQSGTLAELLVALARQRPWLLARLPYWILRGRARLRERLADAVSLDPSALPYRQDFLQWLRDQKRSGRRLVLVSAADHRVVSAVASHTGLFDHLLGSQDGSNLEGAAKVAAIQSRFGQAFDYAGSSSSGLEVWRHCRKAILVNAHARVERAARSVATVEHVFPPRPRSRTPLLRSMRLHQWSKNLLIFVPVLTGHQFTQPRVAFNALVLFLALGLAASAGYLINDLLDVAADRRHPTKRRRPIAAGELTLSRAALLAALLASAGLLVASWVGLAPAALTAFYLALSVGYSVSWKRYALVDAFVLSGLYVLRIVIGHQSGAIAYSPWLLSFATFVFFSLAVAKRVSELIHAKNQEADTKARPDYSVADLQALTVFGIASGYCSVGLFAIYVDSRLVHSLYAQPGLLFLVMPILLIWINRFWLKTCRGEISEDPVLDVLKDGFSYVAAAAALLLTLLAAKGWIRFPML